MKAAVRYSYGPPSSIKITQVPKPLIKPGEIIIEVHASSVNRTDDGFLRAKPFITRFFSGLTKPRQLILGCEFAGKVVEAAEDVGEFAVGDRVFGFDDVRWGGHGEFKVISANKSVVKIPDNVSYEQAAVSTEGAHYALSYMQTIQKLGAKRVLIHGATGAIGSAAAQLFKDAGMYVVATSPTKQLELVRKLGADKVIDWQKTDFTACGEQFDVVFDAVGKSRFTACRKLLVPKGVYISTELGPFGQNPMLGILSPFYKLVGAKRVLFPLPLNKKSLITYIAERLESGTFKPLIDRTYKLDEIADAYLYVESGQKIGNVVVKHE